MKELITKIIQFLMKTPLFPYWLWKLKQEQGIKTSFDMAGGLLGEVLEVGSGDGGRKSEILNEYNKIEKYTASDFSSWDEEFSGYIKNKSSTRDTLAAMLYGYKTNSRNIDVVCSATDLPFKAETFDFHLSFEVLEHIDDPFKFFEEAYRVIKSGGYIVLSVPYLFRMHGGEPEHRLDTFRYSNGFFYYLESRLPLELKGIHHNTGLGTTLATLIIQFFAVRFTDAKRNIIIRGLYLIVTLVLAPFLQIIGYIIDLKPDVRFTSRLHVVVQKK